MENLRLSHTNMQRERQTERQRQRDKPDLNGAFVKHILQKSIHRFTCMIFASHDQQGVR